MKRFPLYLMIVGTALTILVTGCKITQNEGTYTITIQLPEGGARPYIHTVVLEITGEDIDTLRYTKEVGATDASVTFAVTLPKDIVVTLYIVAKDANGIILYWARYDLTVRAGEFTLNIQLNPAAQGAANHIKLFRDSLPWKSYAMDSMLAREGFTPGTGEDEYEILGSAAFDTVTLTPGRDLVIIANDQPQSFYNAYAANQQKFNDFVLAGGIIFWEACDRGWNGGSILDAGITFPGGVTIDSEYVYDNYNYLANPDYELLQGLPDTLYGTYASHETFSNLPEGAQVFTYGVLTQKPTLVLYPYGLGWVLVTGQPLEYCYDRLDRGQTVGLLLPRVVKFILGKEITVTKHYHQPTHLSPTIKSSK